ncbi:MAG: isoleucine--tRNA ligase [Epsilonproteobacteria bacterium]|nr:isoleucine--tRNA ligase [Campylobacterota bacterium]
MDYKNTLLLPNTKFPMRGNLPQNEPIRYKRWFEEKDVYKKMTQSRKDAPSFTLHDGPPYANGNIHIGHALNKILKDIVVKSNYFFGKNIRYVPGWDCHGLPIEQQVEKKLGTEKKETLPKATIRRLCREHADKFVGIQKDSFKNLGIVADWENPYLTMKYAFEADIFRTLCNIAHKGLLIERSKPVYWSWAAKTALAEAEVEYEDKEDYSIYVAFELEDEAKAKLGVDRAAVVIWTTTPWTLPANMGISLNPEEDYVLTTDGYIVAKARYESLFAEAVFSGVIAQTFKGEIIENLFAANPLNGRRSQILLGDHVMMDGGSGCVHTAPGHGEDDYRVGLKYALEVIMPVDDGGLFDETVVREKLLPNPENFVGMHIFKSNEPILEILGDSLLKMSKFTHSYPFCWRTHKPVIYRATRQWFIAMDQKNGDKTLRETAMDEIANVKFYPETGRNRLSSMIENRPDWCISRQRDWGVPIAFFRDKTTGEVILDEKVLNFLAMIFEQKGTDVWWEMEIRELLYPGSGLDPENLEKVTDILDVWFDSGSTWQAVLKSREYDAGAYSADIYLEGSDQHRGWFQSSLLISSAVNNKSPYKNLITHGFTNDAKGQKMSKSKGNVVSPEDISKKFGVEILRLWVGMVDYMGDQKISDDILKQMAEQYRKTRNTLRFLLSNIDDLETIIPLDEMGTLDKWIVNKAKKVFDQVETYFKSYEFSKGLSLLNHFITVELSGIHMDISKDRLYCNAKDDAMRRSAQSAMAVITKGMMALLAPVLTYTIDEVLEYAPKVIKDDAEDVFDLLYTPLESTAIEFDETHMMEAREKFFEIVDGLKKEKKIKATLELSIQTDSAVVAALDNTDAEDWFTVSEVSDLTEQEAIATFDVTGSVFKIALANKAKCPRCWKLNSKDEETLCQRCDEVLN